MVPLSDPFLIDSMDRRRTEYLGSRDQKVSMTNETGDITSRSGCVCSDLRQIEELILTGLFTFAAFGRIDFEDANETIEASHE